ncbi:uncharacterized protein LOC125946777 [Dermacentor silvarum]|uniref:uncharacterized protein LOC125946777 n=1 Tax=Dermacentor silvarum TaxID=543639 RepID=UPI00210111F1|nr:uncharacterized protein LOC125946777 [Dermacentor silvarum]
MEECSRDARCTGNECTFENSVIDSNTQETCARSLRISYVRHAARPTRIKITYDSPGASCAESTTPLAVKTCNAKFKKPYIVKHRQWLQVIQQEEQQQQLRFAVGPAERGRSRGRETPQARSRSRSLARSRSRSRGRQANPDTTPKVPNLRSSFIGNKLNFLQVHQPVELSKPAH